MRRKIEVDTLANGRIHDDQHIVTTSTSARGVAACQADTCSARSSTSRRKRQARPNGQTQMKRRPDTDLTRHGSGERLVAGGSMACSCAKALRGMWSAATRRSRASMVAAKGGGRMAVSSGKERPIPKPSGTRDSPRPLFPPVTMATLADDPCNFQCGDGKMPGHSRDLCDNGTW